MERELRSGFETKDFTAPDGKWAKHLERNRERIAKDLAELERRGVRTEGLVNPYDVLDGLAEPIYDTGDDGEGACDGQ